MSRATTAAETFSSLKKTIQSKFVSQDNILLNDSSVVEPDLNAKPIEKFDDRPLYIRLAETRNKEEEEFDAQFMLSKRVHKITEDEGEFYDKLWNDEHDKYKSIWGKEKEALAKFRADSLKLAETSSKAANSDQTPESQDLAPHSDFLSAPKRSMRASFGVIVKKRGISTTDHTPKVLPDQLPPGVSQPTNSIVAQYDSDSD